MLVYLYDGSFEGLLTSVYEAYYVERPGNIVKEEHYMMDLLDRTVHVDTDVEKASKVSGAILEKLSNDVFIHVLYAYLAEDKESAMAIYEFLRYAFKAGSKVIDFESHDKVSKLLKLSRGVTRESHRLLGLIRFMKLDNGIYYCRFEPTYNLLTLLAPHFSNRMADQSWVIHDVKRGIAAFYDQKKWYINDLEGNIDASLAGDEQLFQDLWKEYFKRIAIKERINPKLQRQMMPKKYWKHLIEIE